MNASIAVWSTSSSKSFETFEKRRKSTKHDMSSPRRSRGGPYQKHTTKRPLYGGVRRMKKNPSFGRGRGPRSGHRFRVNRNTTCPLLLRLFPHGHATSDGTPMRRRKPEEYSWYSRVDVPLKENEEGKSPGFSELRLYTWKDATLNELYGCVTKTVMESENEEMKRVLSDGKGVAMVFSLVYPDRNGKLVMRQIGRVSGSKIQNQGGGGGGEETSLTLERVGFQIGDFLDVEFVVGDVDVDRLD